jgi:diguanylate cyclase (GGDEF)-like protein
MGGDEFAVVLVQASAMTAQAKAEALVRTLEQSPIQFGDWSAPLHLSYGVCEIPHDGEPEAIVAQADAAMFIRKRERQTG